MTDYRMTPETGRIEVTGQPVFFIRKVGSTAALRAAIAEMGPVSNLVFRGYYVPQGNDATAPRALATGLERVCHEIDGALHNAPLREIAIVREFMRRAHHYLPDVPRDENWFEWLALMQHHGAPTRFLDWTYSPSVAVHFALAHASRQPGADLAVWAINTEWCLAASADACAAVGLPAHHLLREVQRRTEHHACLEFFGRELPPSVWPINPFRLNERLTLQRGIFLAPGDVRRSFGTNLRALRGYDSPLHVTHFVLPRSESANVARELSETNVTDATLFPGLDGFAKSLWTSVRFLDTTNLKSLPQLLWGG